MKIQEIKHTIQGIFEELPWGFNYPRIKLQNATNFFLGGCRKVVAPVSSVRPTSIVTVPASLCCCCCSNEEEEGADGGELGA